MPRPIGLSLLVVLLGVRLTREDGGLHALGLVATTAGLVGLVVGFHRHGVRWLLPEPRSRLLAAAGVAVALVALVLLARIVCRCF